MPIDIERFEEDPVEELRASGRTNAEEILEFLASSPDQAYTPNEIHDATGVARGSVGVVLSRLEDRGLVRHRGEYWAIADVEDLDKTFTAMTTARAMTNQFGSEDPDEWGPGVDAETADE
jgi:predicted transcriptional regulator of viral defense system